MMESATREGPGRRPGRFRQASAWACLCALVLCLASLAQAEPGLFPAWRAEAPPEIDGNLGDWNAPAIDTYPMEAKRAMYGVEFHAAWDLEALYLALRYRDPSPMTNGVDPATKPGEGWRSDCFQGRFITDYSDVHLTAWYSSRWNSSVAQLNYQGALNPENMRLFRQRGLELRENNGFEMAMATTADGQGYVQELRIPWPLLFRIGGPAAGDRIGFTGEFMWGGPTGDDWPALSWAAPVGQPGNIRTGLYRLPHAWGQLELLDATAPQPATVSPNESVTSNARDRVEIEVPLDATNVTLVLEDSRGRLLRVLAADHALTPQETETTADGRRLARVAIAEIGGVPVGSIVRGLARGPIRLVKEDMLLPTDLPGEPSTDAVETGANRTIPFSPSPLSPDFFVGQGRFWRIGPAGTVRPFARIEGVRDANGDVVFAPGDQYSQPMPATHLQSQASGLPREYCIDTSGGVCRVYMSVTDDLWRCVTAIGAAAVAPHSLAAGHDTGALATGAFAWTDRNQDGVADAGEMQWVPELGSVPFYDPAALSPTPSLAWCFDGHAWQPVDFLRNGGPVYDLSAGETLPGDAGGHRGALAPTSFGYLGLRRRSDDPAWVGFDRNGTLRWEMREPPDSPNAPTGRRIAGIIRLDHGDVLALASGDGGLLLVQDDGLVVGRLDLNAAAVRAGQHSEHTGAAITRSSAAENWNRFATCRIARLPDGKVRIVWGRQAVHLAWIEGLDHIEPIDPRPLEQVLQTGNEPAGHEATH